MKEQELNTEQKVRLNILKNKGAYTEYEDWMTEKPFNDMTDEEFDKVTSHLADNYYVMSGRGFCDDLFDLAEVVGQKMEKETTNSGRRKVHKKRRKRRNR